mgnify:CR=1 FL=1
MANYIIPVFLIILCVYCLFKKINAYNHFVAGAKESVDLCINTFPYLVEIFLAVELFKISGLSAMLANFLAPFFKFLGMPSELTEFLVLRPFTGSGSLAMLSEIFTLYGADSYIAKCACVIMSCSETTFYIVAIYFSTIKLKKLRYTIPVALLATFLGSILACFICRIL